MLKYIKPLSLYAVPNLFSKGIAFLLLIILSHYLSPGEQGIYTLFTVYVGVLFPVIHIGITSAAQVEYFKMNRAEFKKYLISSLSIVITIFLGILVLLLLFGNHLAGWMNIPFGWLFMIPIVAFARAIPTLVSAIYRSMEKALKYALFNMSLTLFCGLFTLLFVIIYHMQSEGRILGIAIPTILFFFIGLLILKKNNLIGMRNEITKEYQRSALSFGLPLIPHLIAVILIDTSDKIFIANKVSVYEVGIYNMGYKFGALTLLLENIFINVWNPFLFARLNREEPKTKYEIVRQAYFFFALILASVFLITLISPFFFDHIIDKQYKDGIQFVFWVALGYAFYSMFNMLGSIILFTKKTAALSYLSIANVILNLVLNYFLINSYGAMGAAYATFISFLLIFISGFIYVNSIIKLPWFDPGLFSKNDVR